MKQHNSIHLGTPPNIVQSGWNRHGLTKDDVFMLEDAWSLHCVAYRAIYELEGERYELKPGTITLAPPKKRLKWTYLDRDAYHYYVHFKTHGSGDTRLPITLDLLAGETLEDRLCQFEVIRENWKSRPHKAQACLWWLLHDMESESRTVEHKGHPEVLQTFIAIVNHEMHTKLPIAALLARLGIGHSTLQRWCKEAFHCSPQQYIQSQRVQRVEQLLKETDIEFSNISSLVGIDNAQQFNKWCKKHLGTGPMQYRAMLPYSLT